MDSGVGSIFGRNQYDPMVLYMARSFTGESEENIASRIDALKDGCIAELCLAGRPDSHGDNERVFLSKTKFYWAYGKAGEGTFTKVYWAFTYLLTSGTSESAVVKLAKHKSASYQQEAATLGSLSPRSKVCKTIDHFRTTGKIGDLEFAECDPSDCDLESLDYTTHKRPVSFVVGQLRDAADALARFHRADLIHGDIKSNNLLVNYRGRGKLTDFGFCKPLSHEAYDLLAAPTYGAPFIWPNLYEQYLTWDDKGGLGRQTKATEFFAFGRTIYRDVIAAIAAQMANQYGLDGFVGIRKQLKLVIRPRRAEVVDSLKQLEKQYPGRLLVSDVTGKSIKLFVFDSVKNRLDRALTWIDKLQESHLPGLDPTECAKLRSLAELASGLQGITEADICEFLDIEYGRQDEGDLLAQAVITRLNAILGQAEPQDPQHNTSINGMENSSAGNQKGAQGPKKRLKVGMKISKVLASHMPGFNAKTGC